LEELVEGGLLPKLAKQWEWLKLGRFFVPAGRFIQVMLINHGQHLNPNGV
jgi:hypothetical protein